MNKQLPFSTHFSIKGFTSIQIGFYFLIASYLIKKSMVAFLVDDNPIGMLSPEILEYLIIAIGILLFIFSSLAIIFSAKRQAKQKQIAFWNLISKKTIFNYLVSFTIFFIASMILNNQGYTEKITPFFLLFYGIFNYLFQIQKLRKQPIISIICCLLAVICLLIPSYWYPSLLILGIAHITIGMIFEN